MAKDALRFLGDYSGQLDCTCNILDKESAVFTYIAYMFDRTNKMFRYEGMPDTIPEYLFEYMLQIYGTLAVLEHKGSLYAFACKFGGPPDPYYRPTQAVIANPALALSATYRVVNHLPPFDPSQWSSYPPCVYVQNDSQRMGLLSMYSRYAVQMAENDISIRCSQINLRSQSVIVASDGREIESAKQYMKDLEDGKLGIIAERPFLEGVSVNNSTNKADAIHQLLELQQYLKASWYNEVGLNSNFTMKYQYVSEDEINSTADIMLPLVDNMLYFRQKAVDDINRQFGTSISVEKDSAWEKKQLRSDLSVDTILDSSNDTPIPVDQTTSEQIAQNGVENQEGS